MRLSFPTRLFPSKASGMVVVSGVVVLCAISPSASSFLHMIGWVEEAQPAVLLCFLDAYCENLAGRWPPDLVDPGSLACRCKSRFTSTTLCSMWVTDAHSTCRVFIPYMCFFAKTKLSCSALGWRTIWWNDSDTKGPRFRSVGFLQSFLTSPSSLQCVGCHRHLGGTATGVQVRIRNRKPYCEPCYFQLKCEYWSLRDNDLDLSETCHTSLFCTSCH